MSKNYYQTFIIAKPEGQRYRALAGVRHRYADGGTALTTCYRLLQIFSDNANRISIQQELAFAAEFFENATEADIEALAFRKDFGRGMDGLYLPFPYPFPCPFPFITTCVVVGASCNPDLGLYGSADEDLTGRIYHPRYTDGAIIVLDITELGNLHYCFVDVCGMESARKVPLHTPFNGWTYLRAHYDDSSEGFLRNKTVTGGLDNYALVELATLVDCWPNEDWQPIPGGGDSKAELARTGSNKVSVPSLRTLSQNTLFQYLVSSEEPPDLTLLDGPMRFHGFPHDLQRYLTENAGALSNSPVAVDLLKKAFWGEEFFDFTPFQGKLSADDLVTLASSGALRNVKVANLSGFDSPADTRAVAAIMEHLTLDSLYLLARPGRATDNPSEMLDALAKCQKQPLVRVRLVLGSAFSHSIRQKMSVPRTPTSVDPSYWKTFPVIQLFYNGPDAFAFDQPWLTHFFLGDASLTPVRFVTGLLNVIKYYFQCPARAGFYHGQPHVPLNLALASSSFKTFTAATEVGPIPAEAFASGRRDNETEEIPMRPIHPVGWTAVVVHTATKMQGTWEQVPGEARFRVALVRSKDHPCPVKDFLKGPCAIEVVDLKGFLELTAPEHADDLVTCLADLTAWAETDEEFVSNMTEDEVVSTLRAFAERRG